MLLIRARHVVSIIILTRFSALLFALSCHKKLWKCECQFQHVGIQLYQCLFHHSKISIEIIRHNARYTVFIYLRQSNVFFQRHPHPKSTVRKTRPRNLVFNNNYKKSVNTIFMTKHNVSNI